MPVTISKTSCLRFQMFKMVQQSQEIKFTLMYDSKKPQILTSKCFFIFARLPD